MMSPKNVLLITTDQQSATMMSCTGNAHLHTPNLDALARDGIRFEKAYSAQPLCIPQRCSWYTGLMPHQHGVTFNLPDRELRSRWMLGQLFRDAGYSTGYSGKWHINVPTEDTTRHGFEWTHNLRNNGADLAIVDDFKRFLQEEADRPFLFSASFNNPHNICEAARGGPFPDGHPGLAENLAQLPPLPDNFGIPAREPSIIREMQGRYGAKNYPTANWDEARWRLHRWYYCRLNEIVDRRIGELLDVLQASKRWDDTLVVFTSDHGEGDAHHQWNQKQVLYDESLRVPFLVAQPGSGVHQVDHRQLVNTGIDLLPTLCGLAEFDGPDQLPGQDWSGVLRSPEQAPRRDHIVLETEFGTYGKPTDVLGRAVRTQSYKYAVYSRGDNPEFFVNMDDDPGETVNLVGQPDHQRELEHHRSLLRSYVEQTNDIFPLDRIPASAKP